MGAYGSPELTSPDLQPRYSPINYSSYGVPPHKHRSHGGLTFFVGVAVGALILYSVSYLSDVSKSPKTSVAVVSSVSSVVLTDSDLYLRSWAEAVVKKGLLYPDSAKFSDNATDWTVLKDGSTCSITSIVNAEGKSGISGTTTFTVTLIYDDLNAQAIYLKIGDNIVYQK